MRYRDWDVLLFPKKSWIPLQEFRTTCHVTQDQGEGGLILAWEKLTTENAESLQIHNSLRFLPTITTFVPALVVGEPFRVSVHAWINPEPSDYAKAYSKYPENVTFEARVFIDGKLASSKIFDRTGPYPQMLETGTEMDKHGNVLDLAFPPFHRELLTQTYWNPADDLGRITLVLAEGFRRDSITMPFERVKSIAEFSFQHAPLDVLENSSIAWPNVQMWHQMSTYMPYFQHGSPIRIHPDPDLHGHSPRRGELPLSSFASGMHPIGTRFPSANTGCPRAGSSDPFIEIGGQAQRWRRVSNDISMPDYATSNSDTSLGRRVTDSTVASASARNATRSHSPPLLESNCESLAPFVPDNTPQKKSGLVKQYGMSTELGVSATSDKDKGDCGRLTTCTTVPEAVPLYGADQEVKGRKENLHISSPFDVKEGSSSGSNRKVAHVFPTSSSGHKRQRVITPAAYRAIDEEDEPRSSPAARKLSQHQRRIPSGSTNRRALSGVENVL